MKKTIVLFLLTVFLLTLYSCMSPRIICALTDSELTEKIMVRISIYDAKEKRIANNRVELNEGASLTDALKALSDNGIITFDESTRAINGIKDEHGNGMGYHLLGEWHFYINNDNNPKSIITVLYDGDKIVIKYEHVEYYFDYNFSTQDSE